MKTKFALLTLFVLSSLLLLALVAAADVPVRNVGVVPVNYSLVLPTQPSNTTAEQPQRIVYVEPENETYEQVPLQGDIVQFDDSEGYYVLLGDSSSSTNIHIEFSNMSQDVIRLGEQMFLIKHSKNLLICGIILKQFLKSIYDNSLQ